MRESGATTDYVHTITYLGDTELVGRQTFLRDYVARALQSLPHLSPCATLIVVNEIRDVLQNQVFWLAIFEDGHHVIE